MEGVQQGFLHKEPYQEVVNHGSCHNLQGGEGHDHDRAGLRVRVREHKRGDWPEHHCVQQGDEV